VRLIPPLHTQHNEGVGGCNEGCPNAASRQLEVGHNEGEISNNFEKNICSNLHLTEGDIYFLLKINYS